ncbi:MAG: UTP--glucose-1-phosphate uridylyltransferase [Candidatus Magasanikbacteria bacterium]
MSAYQKEVKKGVITAAGLGTRFLPATKAMPKEMLPVLGKPVLQYIVEEMAESGIEDILLVTSSNKNAVEDHFDRDYDYEEYLEKEGKKDRIQSVIDVCEDVDFYYTRQSRPLGNGHALLQAKRFVGDESFAFSDGDSVIDYDTPPVKQMLNAYHETQECVIGVQKLEDKQEMTKYGNVYVSSTDEDRTYKVDKLVEKPDMDNVSDHGIIIAGMRYIFTNEIWKYLETQDRGKDDEIWVSDAANRMLNEGAPFYAYEYEGEYFDTGNPEAMLKAEMHFAKKKGLIN